MRLPHHTDGLGWSFQIHQHCGVAAAVSRKCKEVSHQTLESHLDSASPSTPFNTVQRHQQQVWADQNARNFRDETSRSGMRHIDEAHSNAERRFQGRASTTPTMIDSAPDVPLFSISLRRLHHEKYVLHNTFGPPGRDSCHLRRIGLKWT